MFFHHLHSFGRSEAKQGPVSLLEDHSAENLPSHCLPSSFSLCLASPSCLVLRHPWQEVKPWTGWQHSSPQSLVGELEDSCQELRWQTSLDDHSGKFPQAESSAAVFSIVVLRKPAMLLPLLMHSWLSPWTAESPSQYICVFYSWSPSVLVYFCSFIHVHPDEIPHFLFTPQQIRGWSLKEMCLHQSEGLGELRNRRVFPPCARKLHQQGSFKGCCVTCFLGELLLVCRGWACLSLACWHTILGLLQTNAVESDACPEYLVKIPSPLPSLLLHLLPLLHSSPLHLPPLSIYCLPLLLHHNGHWVIVGDSQLYS